MAHAAATLDPFGAAAAAGPRRRQVLESLADDETPVSDLVGRLAWPQPVVSKRLGVLKEVAFVTARRNRQRLDRVNGERLKTIHNWAKTFRKFWSHQLRRIKERAERKSREQSN